MNQIVRTFKAWQYRGGRPRRWARIENRLWAIVFACGFWNRVAMLDVRGRKSGRLISFPVAIARAACGRAVLRQGRRHPVRLEEVAVSQRAPVLRRYLDIAPGARPHFPVTRGAPPSPISRIVPMNATWPAGTARRRVAVAARSR